MTTESIGTARVDVEVNLDKLEAAVSSAKRSVADMSQAAQDQYNKLNTVEKRRVDNLIKQANTLNMTRAEQIAYNAGLRTSGPIIDELNQKLLLNSTRANVAAASQNKYGLSVKQTQFAMRGLPAQITDIITSLQGGQRPLNVLLQQGGQLKDMFGGIVPAARALGSGLLSLVNPLTVGAAAIAALVIGYEKGADESRNFNQSLILTGNYARTSAEELAMLAGEMDQLAGVTTASASAALAQVAATGQFTAEQLELVGRSAEQMRVATGKAIDETIAEFVKLRKDPVDAILELNDKYHFLTQAQFDNIQALKEQGREQEAVTAAFNAYAGAIDQRTPQIEQNLGSLERAWRGLKGAATEAWDQLLSIGRDETTVDKIKQLQKNIAGLQGGSGVYQGMTDAARQRLINQFKADIAAMTKAANKPAATGGGKAVDSQAIRDRMKAEEEFDRLTASNLSKREKLEAEIAEIRKVGLKAGASELEIEKQIGAARARYNESLPKGRKKAKETDPTEAIIARIKQQIALNEEQAKSEDALTSSERLRVTVLQEIERIGGKVSAARRAEIEQLLATAVATGDVVERQKEEAKLKEELARLTNQLSQAEENRRRSAEADLMSIGRGADAVDQARRRLEIEQEYEDGLRDLRDKGIAETDESYIKQEQLLRESRDRMLQVEADFQQKRMELQSDWQQGANRAFDDYVAKASDVAGQTYDFFTNTYDGLAEATAAYATGTKDAFGDLMDDIHRQAVKFLAQQAIKALLQAFGGGGGAGTSTPDNPGGSTTGNIFDLFMGSFSKGGYTGDGGRMEPAGIVHAGEYVMNADATRALGRGVLDRMNAGQVPMMSGGGSVTVNQVNNFDRNNTRATPEQIAYYTGLEAQRAMTRTG